MKNHHRGLKQTCPCGEFKFYDFNRSKLECPKCNKEIILEALVKKKIISKSSLQDNKTIRENPENNNINKVLDDNIDNELESEYDTSTIVDVKD